MFLDGAWTGSVSGESFTAESPATGEAIGEVPKGTRDDAKLAIGAANRSADAWARLTPFARAAALHRVADAVEQRRDTPAPTPTLQHGKPIRDARDQGDEVRPLLREPS